MNPRTFAALVLSAWLAGWALLALALYGVLSWCAPGLPGWAPFALVGGGVLVYEAVEARNLKRRASDEDDASPR